MLEYEYGVRERKKQIFETLAYLDSKSIVMKMTKNNTTITMETDDGYILQPKKDTFGEVLADVNYIPFLDFVLDCVNENIDSERKRKEKK